MHFAHFPVIESWHDSIMESLCGSPGECSSDLREVDCQSCRVSLDLSLEHGLVEQINDHFWVVNGTPLRLPARDERDDYEFFVFNEPITVVRRETRYFDEDGNEYDAFDDADGYNVRGLDVFVHESRGWRVPRPYIGRLATWSRDLVWKEPLSGAQMILKTLWPEHRIESLVYEENALLRMIPRQGE